jgi:hypothetical protein
MAWWDGNTGVANIHSWRRHVISIGWSSREGGREESRYCCLRALTLLSPPDKRTPVNFTAPDVLDHRQSPRRLAARKRRIDFADVGVAEFHSASPGILGHVRDIRCLGNDKDLREAQ